MMGDGRVFERFFDAPRTEGVRPIMAVLLPPALKAAAPIRGDDTDDGPTSIWFCSFCGRRAGLVSGEKRFAGATPVFPAVC